MGLQTSSDAQHRTTTASDDGYRPDIDGLRALAVLAVLFYHAGFAVFTGGFVGVDVFFVISGYLITRILANQLAAHGRIDFAGFYLRRLRRILPALMVTLLATAAVAVAVLTPERLQAFGGSLLHATLSLSNFFFFHESGYFDTDSRLKPLLHTWSLGIEEQFYLVWPLVLMLAGQTQRRQRLAMLALGLASLALAVAVIGRAPSAVFFLMPFRVFEFAIGALLVVLERRGRPGASPADDVLYATGILLIAVPVFFYSKDTLFPGPAAAVPCLGAALCIHTGRRATLAWALTRRPVVAIGLVSYSLYLVHWPLVVFYRYRFDVQAIAPLASTLIVIASLALAWAMHRWVERPFRKPAPSNRRFLLGLGCAVLLLSGIGASMWLSGGWTWRPWMTQHLSTRSIEAGRSLRFTTRQDQCARKGWDRCDALVPGAVNGLILGDSHAPDAHNAFAHAFAAHNFATSTLGGCPPHPDIDAIVAPTHPDLPECRRLNAQRHDPSYLRTFDYIVINVLFGWYTDQHLATYLRFLREAGVRKVVVFGGYLSMKSDLPDLINRYGFSQPALERFVQTRPDDRALRQAAEALDYLFVSKLDGFCGTTGCELFDAARVPFTWDTHHLSYEFAIRLLDGRRDDVSGYLAR